MTVKQLKDFYNKIPVEFVIKEHYNLIEDFEYIPRFSLKNIKEIGNIPINEPIKYSDAIMSKAIRYGMIFLISYKGDKDKHFAGHERVIYPMVLGRSSQGKNLLRGWHLNGWSVSQKRHTNKIWRMFRTDRILSMTFTGSFYRLPPSGYNMNDKGMRGGIITKADFNEIRRNQQALVSQNKIQNRQEVTIGNEDEGNKFVSIQVKETEGSQINLMKPFENPYVNNNKDMVSLRLSFLKSIYGNKYIAVLGALGQPGNTVRIVTDKMNSLGVYKVLDSITGDVLKSIKNVKGNTIYDLYLFDKKL
jgi:hypothetical protein